jgi:glycosyltransferase involved in cell wall biosynthesis
VPSPKAPDFSRLRVALVHDWLNGMRGGERVLEEMCALFPHADLHTLVYEPAKVSPAIRAMKVRAYPGPGAQWLRRHYRRALPLLPALVRRMPTQGYDLVLATSHCVAKAAPPPARGVMAAYVFSPMRYVWDHFEDYLGGGPAQDAALRLLRRPLQRWDRDSSAGIDILAADSAHIAGKLQRFWGRRAEVIHPPVDLGRFRPSGQPPEDFFLVVSALVPYKHVERAITAAKLARVRLVVIGDGPERERLGAMAGDGVTLLGHVPDAELPQWYARCRALLYPGVEDFGITALEAMASGRPVLALGAGGVTETVVEGTTGQFFAEPTAASLAELLGSFEDRRWDPGAIRARAEEFSPLAFRAAVADWIAKELAKR